MYCIIPGEESKKMNVKIITEQDGTNELQLPNNINVGNLLVGLHVVTINGVEVTQLSQINDGDTVRIMPRFSRNETLQLEYKDSSGLS